MTVYAGSVSSLVQGLVGATTLWDAGLPVQSVLNSLSPSLEEVSGHVPLLQIVQPIQTLIERQSIASHPAPSREEVASVLRQAVSDLDPLVDKADGDTVSLLRWAHERLSPLDPASRPAGMTLINDDPTLVLLRGILEASPDAEGFFEVHEGGTLSLAMVNQVMQGVTGLTEEAILGDDFEQNFHRDDQPAITELLTRVSYGGHDSVKRMRLRVREDAAVHFKEGDDYYTWVDVHAGLIPGTNIGHFTLINETERHDALELRAILESVLRRAEQPLGIFELDEAGYPRGILHSSAFGELLGFPPSKMGLRGVAVEEVISPESRAEFKKHLTHFEETGHMEWLGAPMQRADGEIMDIDIHARGSVVHGKTYAVAFYADAEIRLASERARDEAQRHEIHERMRGGIAHDLNNYLTAVLGILSLLQEYEDCIPEHLRDFLQTGVTYAELMRDMISDFRGLTSQHKRVPFDLHTLLSERTVRSGVDISVALERELMDEPRTVMGPPNQILQIILNLLVNANDAMEGMKARDRKISIKTDKLVLDPETIERLNIFQGLFSEVEPGEFTRLTVSDTGKGIAPEVLPRIFEFEFSTKDQSRLRGLGLDVSQRLVADRGGFIRVESTPGKGTTFEVYFPSVVPLSD